MSVDFSSELRGGPSLNFNNGNALAVLNALRLAGEYGECTIPEARRAIIRARSGSLEPFAREAYVEYGKPRAEGNVVTARPIRVIGGGLDVDGLQSRITQLSELIEAEAARGATKLVWG